MSDLKPCPFCGASVTLENNQSFKNPNSDTLYWIECSKCMAFDFESYTSVNLCISAWNTRPIEDALRKEIEQIMLSHEQATNEALKLQKRVHELESDNRSLVEQMNAMALKPNQAVIEYFYPKYNPENRRIENLPTEECPCIVELYSGEYDIVWWIDGGFEETGWDEYCVDEVKSWAYLPKGVKHE